MVLAPCDVLAQGARNMTIRVPPLSDAYLVRRFLVCVQRLCALPLDKQALVEHLRRA